MPWKYVKIYLAGPMDFAADAGVKWRERITEKLINELELTPDNILNPCAKPLNSKGQGLSAEQEICKKLRKDKDWEGLERIVKDIMTIDLRLVDKSDILIANLSYCLRTVGTIHEIISATQRHIPVYIIDEQGMENVSGWLMALVGHERVFTNEDDVIKTIKSIKLHGSSNKKDIKDYLIFDFENKEITA